jgi:hypothetical protein
MGARELLNGSLNWESNPSWHGPHYTRGYTPPPLATLGACTTMF